MRDMRNQGGGGATNCPGVIKNGQGAICVSCMKMDRRANTKQCM